MKGATGYYNLIEKAYRYKIGDLTKIDCPGYGDGYKHKNVVFVLSEHARGETFKIWIYKSENFDDALVAEHLEVYGVIGGQPGWTEEYGWTISASWVDYILAYFGYLRVETEKREIEIEEGKKKIAHEKDLEFSSKVSEFENSFKKLY